MTTRLKQKVAIVTGAGSGIGCATAKLFAREGASVLIADIDPLGKATEDTIREHGGKDALFVPTDVKLEEDVKRMIETAVDRYGRVDILVNGAGLATPGDALKLTEEDWDSCMAVNLKGAWYCSKHAIRHMPKTGGSIVNIASTHPLRSQPNFFPYAVAKGGMLAMTGSLAIDFGPRGVRANSICPGFIDTPMNSRALSKLRELPSSFKNFWHCILYAASVALKMLLTLVFSLPRTNRDLLREPPSSSMAEGQHSAGTSRILLIGN